MGIRYTFLANLDVGGIGWKFIGMIPGCPDTPGDFDRLLESTRNVWDRGDGLACQLRVRDEWEDRDTDR
uniref:Uncharacterized protein n=1 Tax=Candidatus Kentrum eta TaxID=2126337 RepID=A0A450VRC4_9GAMM|nr:MAG: hypothetical protein BECKH772B_GA0070898_104111 [Candidatus Kentron sp. H]VFK04291.1 MAG: hypothetical protein BECKH772A_GA0070896_103993 [Candidatus Kentron sp. H]VFK07330.1 MAG: hypothetical protein BECKH772C_GA0070978_104111 [Candidatus Kentron sp. H]